MGLPSTRPFDGRHDQVMGARIAPDPEPLAKCFDGKRCHASQGVISGKYVPNHRGINVL